MVDANAFNSLLIELKALTEKLNMNEQQTAQLVTMLDNAQKNKASRAASSIHNPDNKPKINVKLLVY